MSTKVQIVIPAINLWKKYTRAAIESVKTKHDYRILLVDNKSSDETSIEAGKLVSDRFSHKRNEERWGCAQTWNWAIKDAFERGFDYVFIINNDVVLREDSIDKLIERFESESADSNLVMATCMDITAEAFPDNMASLNKDGVPEAEHPCFSAFMINRRCWEKVGEFDEAFKPAYFEDNDYHRRIKLAGMKAVVYPPSMFYHYGSRTQNEASEDGRPIVPGPVFENNRAYYSAKWGGIPGSETHDHPFGDPDKDYKWTKQMQHDIETKAEASQVRSSEEHLA